MAESETILRLGIEAAREGNREEARNLFSLLTRQEPDNVQGWLWLAGVAEGPDQRRAALEQVLRLEPENEMALKGLQAMGVSPGARAADEPAPAAAPSLDLDIEPEPTAAPARALTDEELYAAELDSAFDMADELPRAAAPPRREPEEGEAAVGGRGAYDEERPRVRTTPRRRPARVDDDDDTVPARTGVNPLVWVLGALILLAVLLIFLWPSIFPGGGGEATQPTAVPGATTTSPTADPNAPAPTADPNAPAPTADPNAPAPTADPNAPAPTADPNAPAQPAAPTAVPAPVTDANPQAIPANAVISANGWNYTVPGTNICAFGCAVVLGNRVGSFTAQGTFVHVLAFVQNTTGTDQALPADFLVLKDAQGRFHEARPDVAEAAWRPGSADVAHTTPVPANGATTSVYLVFDVPADATDLVLFSRYFTAQGWPVLASVQ